ncbi:MAG: SsrA-binding protein SmpB [SAR324 cluster bacterium]|jgi:SsrA-binding protein|nr:SsrA-binding protein SmpB [SAR324 cluster bacterium]RZO45950.1 MAG: SsrA-binding protein SmpB [Pseudomonadota bacterium]MEC9360494.1 SsrA-binding protein SmpB [SAR324 cluster bacterium]MED5240751.1 SsrA-binding protein SmpB [SAR324 cluster bacterium]MED5516569.1 SsrA-binding protein SmpB [SAR324 cluster bacterium]|tara:strand:- start:1920 stop:2381 length:462 start_codon:yes stop_codon:yes gene_type:complete
MPSKTLAKNRKARFEYEIQNTMEVGIVLKGTEVKSIRAGQINITESFCRVDDHLQVYLLNAHVSQYDFGNIHNHDPLRPRRLLLHRSEIRRLYGQVKEQGLTLIPIKIYLKGGIIKMELALGRGKKMYDKRQTMKKRDAERDVERALSEQSFN